MTNYIYSIQSVDDPLATLTSRACGSVKEGASVRTLKKYVLAGDAEISTHGA